MELIIKRNQDKGFLGGMKFVLEAKVTLTEEEQALIKKYKANKEVLFTSLDLKTKYTINDLIYGIKDKVKDVSILYKNEDIYIDACRHLKKLLLVMESFGGENIFQIKNDGVYDSNGEIVHSQ